MFSKSEPLVHKAHEHKSLKPLLDKTKINLLLGKYTICRIWSIWVINFVSLIKFPEHDQKKLINSLNQKCRDG